MKGYSKEDKKTLCKKYNDNINKGIEGFNGFSLKDKIALVEWQVEVLNENSEITKVRESYKKWEVLLIQLRKQEIIEEAEELLTSNGRVYGVVTENGKIRKICYKCNGSGRYSTSNSNVCKCCYGKGYTLTNKPKEYTIDKYKDIAIEKAEKTIRKRNVLTRIPIKDMELSEIEHWAFGK